MAARLKPTEFGGHTQRNGLAPPVTPLGHPGHTRLSADELLRLEYLTGQSEDTTRAPDNGETMEGLEPLEVALTKMPEVRKWIDDQSA